MTNATPATSTAVATQRDKLRAELARYMPSYEKLLPAHYPADRLVVGAMLAVTRNPELLKCSAQSIAVALAQVAQWNLDVGTTAHLVPFKGRCTAMADYKGYIEQMCKAGARKVEAYVVREGDDFEMQRGTDPFLRHTPKTGDAPIIGAYAIAWFRGGVTQFEFMTAEEIDSIRHANSQNWKAGPLPKWYARKTVIRQLAKYVPKTASLTRLLAEDEVEPDATATVTPDTLAALEAAEAPRGQRTVPQLRDPYLHGGKQVTADGEIMDGYVDQDDGA
jgi:recombination protein RecT